MLTTFEVQTDPAEEVYYNAGLFATRLRDGIAVVRGENRSRIRGTESDRRER